MTESPLRRARVILALIIIGATVLVFTGTLRSRLDGWDDEVYVYKNSRIRTLSPETIAWFFAPSLRRTHPSLSFPMQSTTRCGGMIRRDIT